MEWSSTFGWDNLICLQGTCKAKGEREKGPSQKRAWSWITSACSNCGFGYFCCIFMTVDLEPLKEYDLLLLHVFFMSVCECFPRGRNGGILKKWWFFSYNTHQNGYQNSWVYGVYFLLHEGPHVPVSPIFPKQRGSWAPFFSSTSWRTFSGCGELDISMCPSDSLRSEFRPNDPAFTFNK